MQNAKRFKNHDNATMNYDVVSENAKSRNYLSELDENERLLIEGFQSLSEQEQEIVMATVKALAMKNIKEKEGKHT